MDLIWSIPYLIVIAWLLPRIGFLKNSGLSAFSIRGLFMLKSTVGVGLIMLYTFYYPKGSSDLFNYFSDGEILFGAFKISPIDYFRMLTGIDGDAPHLMHYYDQMNFWLKDFNYNLFNDNRTVIRFNALIMPFSFGNMYVHTFVMNGFVLIGLIGIFRFCHETLKFNKTLALIAVIVPPSLIFWGSGLLKEGIVLFALGIMLFMIGKLIKNPTGIKHWVVLGLTILLFSISKFYVMVALVPGLLSWLIVSHSKKPLLHFTIVHAVLLAAIFLLPFIQGFPDIPSIISHKQNDFVNYAHSLNHVGSLINTERLTSDFGDFMLQSVQGFLTTLLRPHIFEMHSATSIPAAVENVITILLIALAFVFRKRTVRAKDIYLCLSFTVILFALSGMTTPVLGALVRYKIPAQPFLYVILLVSIDWEKIKPPFIKSEKVAACRDAFVRRIFT